MFDLANSALRRFREHRFNRTASAILATRPCRPRNDGVIVFSMIGTKVLLPYLVAAKSFQSRLGRGRFVILDDGTLTASDGVLLRHHLGDPDIRAIGDVDTGPCPRGGTWERLLTILDLRAGNYVIQLDSDTVTLGDVGEINAAIEAGQSFTLRGGIDSEILPLAATSDLARHHATPGRQHVQAAIEQAMVEVAIPGQPELRYVRGCSGFAGFAPNPDGRGLAEAFSQEAERLLGRSYWSEWGSEQVTSNFVVANQPQALLLPYDRYLNFWNEPVDPAAAFVHFVGTYRFHRQAYKQAALDAIRALG